MTKKIAKLIIEIFGERLSYLIADDLYSYRDGDFDE